jgi:NAD(P)-dependent dehydrogenase (short-subunit alcohol dehydrogenase family)
MSDTPLAGRVAVVSGGGRGLGRSFCLALARQGAKVVVNNRNRVTDADGRGPADHVAGQITAADGEAVAEHSDAADPAGGEAIVAAAVERWGRLDICVANAAIGPGGMFHKQPAAQFGEVLEINLQGSVRLARAAMAVMRPAGYGRIILVGSTGGLHGDVGLSAYATSKGGLLAFGRSLAAEGAGKGVPRWPARSAGRTGRVSALVSCTPCWPRAGAASRARTGWPRTRSMICPEFSGQRICG